MSKYESKITTFQLRKAKHRDTDEEVKTIGYRSDVYPKGHPEFANSEGGAFDLGKVEVSTGKPVPKKVLTAVETIEEYCSEVESARLEHKHGPTKPAKKAKAKAKKKAKKAKGKK